MSYDVLKNRLSNGTPFLIQTALDRIGALADNLEITQDQAEKLTELAQANGSEILPPTAMERLRILEAQVQEMQTAMEASVEGYNES